MRGSDELLRPEDKRDDKVDTDERCESSLNLGDIKDVSLREKVVDRMPKREQMCSR